MWLLRLMLYDLWVWNMNMVVGETQVAEWRLMRYQYILLQ